MLSTGKRRFTPGGKVDGELGALALTASAVFSALAPGASWIAMPDGGLAVHAADDGIALRAQLDARDVAQPDDRAVGAAS